MTILAADLGGSSLRAGLITADGKILRQAAIRLNEQYPQDHWVEQEAESWWRAFQKLAAEVVSAGAGRPDAIVFTGMTRSQVFVDRHHQPLRPAILWRDARAAGEAQTLAGCASQDINPINAYHPLARLLWIKNHEPDVWNSTAFVLQPKDYLILRLTGVAAGDLISSWQYLDAAGTVDLTLLDAAGLDSNKIPPLLAPEAEAGRVTAMSGVLAALNGLPVFCGSLDTWCATLALGANRAGHAYIISGTSEVAGLIAAAPAQTPGLLTLPWGDDLWHLGGPSQAGGDCLRWLAEILETTVAAADELVAAIDTLHERTRHALPPVFLPYLLGERTPIWDNAARGVWFGLDRRHSRDDLLWSVLEGVACHNRHVLELAEQALAIRSSAVHIGGGGARSDLWCQVRADVLDRPLLRSHITETGLLGAAMLALQGLGLYRDRDELQQRMAGNATVFQPDPERHAIYQQFYTLYRELSAELTPRFARLEALRSQYGEDNDHNLRILWSRC